MAAPAIRAWAVGVLLALLTALLVATPASAHAELETSDPADGATLATPPATVSFTFGEDLLEQGNAIVVTDVTTGTRVMTEAVAVAGDTVSVAWPDSAAAGEYRVAFRVVSADGHPIEGAIGFTVQGPTPVPSAEASVPQTSAPTVTATPAATSTEEPATEEPATEEPATEDDDVSEPAWILGIGVVTLAAVVGGAWYLRRNR